MQHPSTRRPIGRTSAVALVVALLAGVTAACAPSTPPTPTTQQFCEFYNKVEQKIADAPPEVPDAAVLDNDAVLVKNEVVAAAEQTTVAGSDCTDAAAKVELDQAVLAEGKEVPSEQGNAASEPVAAVTGDEISPEQPVLDNVQIKALSASIAPTGITVRGNVAVRLSGQTSTIGFIGTLSNLNNWSVTLSSSALTIPGITSSPATFSGTLAVKNGVPTLSLTAAASSAKIGDVTVTGASINLVASPATGVTAAVQGNIKVGPSTAGGVVNVSFDKAGALVSAKADIQAHLVGTQAGGKKIDLTGSVKLEGNAQQTVASFSGSGIVGDLVVNQANGSLTLATNKATFVGVLDVQQGANYVRFNGSIVWDGITAYTPFLTLEGGGEFSGTLNDGQTVSVAGTVETTVVGGQIRAVVTGAFKVGTLKANGSAIVETNGATTTLFVDADLANAGFAAKLEGAIIITDGRAETVQLDAAVTGAVQLGDVTLTGATLSIRSSYGSPLDLSFNGGLKVGNRANLSGTVAASFGPNGALLSMTGQLTGSLTLDSWGLLNFNGSVVASPEQVTLSGSGGISMINFPLGVTFNGSFTSSLTQPSWSLNGSGKLRIASLEIASARLNLSQGVGMKATRAGFYFTLIGIPFYFEGDFYMKPTGGCEKINITGGSFLMRPLLGAILPGVVGCPVNT
jgi:hypothetical protein